MYHWHIPCNISRKPTRAELRHHRMGSEFVLIAGCSLQMASLLFLFAYGVGVPGVGCFY